MSINGALYRILLGLACAPPLLALGGTMDEGDEWSTWPPVPPASSRLAAVHKELPAVQGEYRIGAEDILEITVWKEEGLKKEIVVRPDGGISFPLVGTLVAAGKTPKILEQEVAKALEKYIPDPVVSVAVVKVLSNKVYVLGKVNRPGEFSAGRYVDVLQALAMAGGLTPFAEKNAIKILRRNGDRELAIPFFYSQVENGDSLDQNIPLKGGDVLIVP
ncbi:MAG: polysaccharide biosynthesis/export family protein [Pseudomonadota bacterium]